MAAPEYVPTSLEEQPRQGLALPPPDHWLAGDEHRLGPRPGELGPDQPTGRDLGHQGPDQGYVLLLARRFRDRLRLGEGEHADDAIAGAVSVALKRASLFGRAPMIHDVESALNIWGFLDDAPADLVERRRRLFQGVSNPHHYPERGRIADLVPDEILRKPPSEVRHSGRELLLGMETHRSGA